MAKKILVATLFVLGVAFAAIYFMVKVSKDNNAKVANMALQLSINNSLISEETHRIRITNIISDESAGRMTPEECVEAGIAMMDGWNLYKIPPHVIMAIIYKESRFTPGAKSNMGALGVMQIMPSTGLPYAAQLGQESEDIHDVLLDTDMNIRIGTMLIHDLMRSEKRDVWKALTVYAYGEKAAFPFFEKNGTKLSEYAAAVSDRAQFYRNRGVL